VSAPSRRTRVLTITFASVRNGTVFKAEALTCAVAPAHGPQRWASGSLHRAALRERVRWGDLRPELGRGTLLCPPYRNCNSALILRQLAVVPAWPELLGLSSFLHNGGLGSFEQGPLPAYLIDDPCLDCPLAVEAFSVLAFPPQLPSQLPEIYRRKLTNDRTDQLHMIETKAKPSHWLREFARPVLSLALS
jgi:hypothetical protein